MLFFTINLGSFFSLEVGGNSINPLATAIYSGG